MSITRATFGASAALSAALLALTSTAHAAEGGGGSLPQLDVATYPSQLFWLLVSFVALYLLLSKVALPRVSEVLESRQERIDNDLAKAQQLRDEAATVQAAYEASLAESRTKAQGVVSAANADIAARLAASEEGPRANPPRLCKPPKRGSPRPAPPPWTIFATSRPKWLAKRSPN